MTSMNLENLQRPGCTTQASCGEEQARDSSSSEQLILAKDYVPKKLSMADLGLGFTDDCSKPKPIKTTKPAFMMSKSPRVIPPYPRSFFGNDMESTLRQ